MGDEIKKSEVNIDNNIYIAHLLFDNYLRENIANNITALINGYTKMLDTKFLDENNINIDIDTQNFLRNIEKNVKEQNLIKNVPNKLPDDNIKQNLTPDNVEKCIDYIINELEEYNQFYSTYTWYLHATSYIIIKLKDNYRFIFNNTADYENHDNKDIFIKMISMSNINLDMLKNILNKMIINLNYSNAYSYNDKIDGNIFYEEVINYLLENGGKYDDYNDNLVFIKQTGGTCTTKALLILLQIWLQTNYNYDKNMCNQLELSFTLKAAEIFTQKFDMFSASSDDDVNLVTMTIISLKNKIEMMKKCYDLEPTTYNKKNYDKIIKKCEKTLLKYYEYTECITGKGTSDLICNHKADDFIEEDIKEDNTISFIREDTQKNIFTEIGEKIKINEIDSNVNYFINIDKLFDKIDKLILAEFNIDEVIDLLYFICVRCNIINDYNFVSNGEYYKKGVKIIFIKILKKIYEIKIALDNDKYHIKNIFKCIFQLKYIIFILNNLHEIFYQDTQMILNSYYLFKCILIFMLCDILIKAEYLNNVKNYNDEHNSTFFKNIKCIFVVGYINKVKKYILNKYKKYEPYLILSYDNNIYEHLPLDGILFKKDITKIASADYNEYKKNKNINENINEIINTGSQINKITSNDIKKKLNIFCMKSMSYDKKIINLKDISPKNNITIKFPKKSDFRQDNFILENSTIGIKIYSADNIEIKYDKNVMLDNDIISLDNFIYNNEDLNELYNYDNIPDESKMEIKMEIKTINKYIDNIIKNYILGYNNEDDNINRFDYIKKYIFNNDIDYNKINKSIEIIIKNIFCNISINNDILNIIKNCFIIIYLFKKNNDINEVTQNRLDDDKDDDKDNVIENVDDIYLTLQRICNTIMINIQQHTYLFKINEMVHHYYLKKMIDLDDDKKNLLIYQIYGDEVINCILTGKIFNKNVSLNEIYELNITSNSEINLKMNNKDIYNMLHMLCKKENNIICKSVNLMFNEMINFIYFENNKHIDYTCFDIMIQLINNDNDKDNIVKEKPIEYLTNNFNDNIIDINDSLSLKNILNKFSKKIEKNIEYYTDNEIVYIAIIFGYYLNKYDGDYNNFYDDNDSFYKKIYDKINDISGTIESNIDKYLLYFAYKILLFTTLEGKKMIYSQIFYKYNGKGKTSDISKICNICSINDIIIAFKKINSDKINKKRITESYIVIKYDEKNGDNIDYYCHNYNNDKIFTKKIIEKILEELVNNNPITNINYLVMDTKKNLFGYTPELNNKYNLSGQTKNKNLNSIEQQFGDITLNQYHKKINEEKLKYSKFSESVYSNINVTEYCYEIKYDTVIHYIYSLKSENSIKYLVQKYFENIIYVTKNIDNEIYDNIPTIEFISSLPLSLKNEKNQYIYWFNKKNKIICEPIDESLNCYVNITYKNNKFTVIRSDTLFELVTYNEINKIQILSKFYKHLTKITPDISVWKQNNVYNIYAFNLLFIYEKNKIKLNDYEIILDYVYKYSKWCENVKNTILLRDTYGNYKILLFYPKMEYLNFDKMCNESLWGIDEINYTQFIFFHNTYINKNDIAIIDIHHSGNFIMAENPSDCIGYLIYLLLFKKLLLATKIIDYCMCFCGEYLLNLQYNIYNGIKENIISYDIPFWDYFIKRIFNYDKYFDIKLCEIYKTKYVYHPQIYRINYNYITKPKDPTKYLRKDIIDRQIEILFKNIKEDYITFNEITTYNNNNTNNKFYHTFNKFKDTKIFFNKIYKLTMDQKIVISESDKKDANLFLFCNIEIKNLFINKPNDEKYKIIFAVLVKNYTQLIYNTNISDNKSGIVITYTNSNNKENILMQNTQITYNIQNIPLLKSDKNIQLVNCKRQKINIGNSPIDTIFTDFIKLFENIMRKIIIDNDKEKQKYVNSVNIIKLKSKQIPKNILINQYMRAIICHKYLLKQTKKTNIIESTVKYIYDEEYYSDTFINNILFNNSECKNYSLQIPHYIYKKIFHDIIILFEKVLSKNNINIDNITITDIDNDTINFSTIKSNADTSILTIDEIDEEDLINIYNIIDRYCCVNEEWCFGEKKEYCMNNVIAYFEYIFGNYITPKQMELCYNIYNSVETKKQMFHHLIMGGGKSSVVLPLATLMLFTRQEINNVFIVVPPHLLNDVNKIIKNICGHIKQIRIINLPKNDNDLESFNIVFSDIKSTKKSIYITDSTTLKKKFLHHINSDSPLNLKNTFVISDEIDLLSDPLKSELNKPEYSYNKEYKILLLNITKSMIYIFECIKKYCSNKKSPNFFMNEPHLYFFNKDIYTKKIDEKTLIEVLNENKIIEKIYKIFPVDNTNIMKIITKPDEKIINEKIISKIFNTVASSLTQLHLRNYGVPSKNITNNTNTTSNNYDVDDLDDIYKINFATGCDDSKTYPDNVKSLNKTEDKLIYCAIPYSAVNTPDYGSEFADYYNILAYTILSFTDSKSDLNNDIIDEVLNDKYISDELLNKILNFNPKINNRKILLEKIKTENLYDKLRNNSIIILKIFEYIIENKMKETISELNCSYFDILSSKFCEYRSGFTGTPNMINQIDIDNEKQIEPIKENEADIQNIKVSFTGVKNDEIMKIPVVHKIKSGNLLNEICKLINDKKYSAFIDTGSLLLKNNTLEVINFMRENITEKKYFVYYNDNDKPIILEKNNKIKGRPYFVGSVNLNELFIYFDNKHCTGTDTKLSLNAKGLVSVRRSSRFRDISQGVFRMRNINKGQTIDIVILDSEFSGILSADGIYKLINDNENKYYKNQESYGAIELSRTLIRDNNNNKKDFYKIDMKNKIFNTIKEFINDIQKYLNDDTKKINIQQKIRDLLKLIKLDDISYEMTQQQEQQQEQQEQQEQQQQQQQETEHLQYNEIMDESYKGKTFKVEDLLNIKQNSISEYFIKKIECVGNSVSYMAFINGKMKILSDIEWFCLYFYMNKNIKTETIDVKLYINDIKMFENKENKDNKKNKINNFYIMCGLFICGISFDNQQMVNFMSELLSKQDIFDLCKIRKKNKISMSNMFIDLLYNFIETDKGEINITKLCLYKTYIKDIILSINEKITSESDIDTNYTDINDILNPSNSTILSDYQIITTTDFFYKKSQFLSLYVYLCEYIKKNIIGCDKVSGYIPDCKC